MNRIILSNDFELLKKIISEVCHVHINSKIDAKIEELYKTKKDIKPILQQLRETNFKSFYWQKYVQDDDITRENLTKVLHYDYYLTPYEGIYINENIIGLIKYLTLTSQIKDDRKETLLKAQEYVKKNMHEQDTQLTFSHQQKLVRIWAMTEGIKTDLEIQSFFGIDPKQIVPKRFIKVSDKERITFDTSQLDIMYNDLKKSYHSDYIFNFDKPIITDILDNYMKHIFDYKILYLLANYKDKSKRQSRCEHQYKLLNNTENFITSIVGK